MVLPQDALIAPDTEMSDTIAPSKTYRIDFDRGCIVGVTDGLEAVKQAVRKILLTERYRHLIYTPDYGAELDGLIGKSQAYVRSELKRRVTEALTQDDRVLDVVDWDIRFEGETAYASFTVVSIFGNFREEVTVGGV